MANPEIIQYPSITVGGKPYQLRFAHSAIFQVREWGYEFGNPEAPIPIAALAAASAGTLNREGQWRSAGFKRVVDMLDLMIDGESLDSFIDPVLEAVGKASPKAELKVVAPPAEQATPVEAAA